MAFKVKLLILITFFTTAFACAQVQPEKKDTVNNSRDNMYKKLENYSKRKKFTKFLHKLIFRPVKVKEPTQNRQEVINKAPEMQETFESHEGRIVRKINIVTLDPFGYSINDTLRRPDNWLHKTGNAIHLKTKARTIRNLLLIKENEPLDSLLIEESERLIRTQRYIRRVVIRSVALPGTKDSVDVNIRVLDAWSLVPNGSFSKSRTSFELSERNFFGLGHQFRNDFDKRLNTGETSYLGRYTIPNIKNTYIRTTATYEIWRARNSLKSLEVQRDFFSAYTKWAGGVLLEERLVRDSLPDTEGRYAMQNFKSKSQDFWGGYSFKIYKGDTEEARTTNLVTTARFLNRAYTERPSFDFDPEGFYASEQLYLLSAGITSRKFVQDKFLFNYDIVEDIPIGKVYSLSGGLQHKNHQNRIYIGGKYAFGNYYKWGFFSAIAEAGTFLYKQETSQATVSLGFLYFSNIRKWGEWKFRNFVKPQLVIGESRMPIITDQLNLNGNNGIQGFDSRSLLGTKKFVLTLQTQSYSPVNFLGFRINPFANVTAGIIGNDWQGLGSSRVYSSIGVGVLIFNDYLTFNNFQLSLAYFPTIPNFPHSDYNVLRTNSFQNNDITLPDFQVGKPNVVPYH